MNEQKLKLIFTDSGLGGISIMAEVANYLTREKPVESAELIFFNSTPDKNIGYNKMKSDEEKINVFNSALYSMKKKFNPDHIFIACNTLSVIYEKTKFAMNESVPVWNIVDFGLISIIEKLSINDNSIVIILGTPTTIKSNTYKIKLIEKGFDEKRIINQSCPDLESEIQKNPESYETQNLIYKYLNETLQQIKNEDAKIFIALCCTHYGFAEKVFDFVLKDMGINNFEIINPNKKMVERIKSNFSGKTSDGFQLKCKVVSKVFFYEEELNSISKQIENISPLVAESLRKYELIEDLF